jgi:ElaB/YqjD/DUF883 family membrane-anchored ribosome-binding protein
MHECKLLALPNQSLQHHKQQLTILGAVSLQLGLYLFCTFTFHVFFASPVVSFDLHYPSHCIETPNFDRQTTMSFFNDARKAVDGFGQEAGKQIGGAANEAGKGLDEFGQEAGKQIGGAADEAGKNLDAFGQEAGKQIGGAANETFKQLDEFGQDAAQKVGPALEEAWRHVEAFGQEAGKQISIAAEHTKQWIEEHPGETAGIIACVVAAPVGIVAAHATLHMVGFTAAGVAAGMFPHLSIGCYTI